MRCQKFIGQQADSHCAMEMTGDLIKLALCPSKYMGITVALDYYKASDHEYRGLNC